jgi:hypothetical protein
MHTIDVGPTQVFAARGPRLITLGASPFSLNLHRQGATINAISLSGLPRRGGTTVCWGRMRTRCEGIDRDPRRLQWRDSIEPDAWIRCFGPFMVRIGNDF